MPTHPDIAAHLRSGWAIVGFSTAFSEAGIIFYSVLLQRGDHLATATIGLNRSTEVYRSIDLLSPEGGEACEGATDSAAARA